MKHTNKAALACAIALITAGCQKAPVPTSEQAGSTAIPSPPQVPSPAGSPEVPGTAAPLNAAPPAPPPPISQPPMKAEAPPPPPAPVVIPAGTHLSVNLESPVSSKTSTVGESFSATLAKGVTVHGVQALGAHMSVIGKVVDAKAAGKFAGAASIGLTLESVGDHVVSTSTYAQQVQGKGKRTAEVIGGTALAGALLGGLVGHGRGALIGAAAGGGAGTLGAAETGNNRDITLPAGTLLTFRLMHSVTLPPL